MSSRLSPAVLFLRGPTSAGTAEIIALEPPVAYAAGMAELKATWLVLCLLLQEL